MSRKFIAMIVATALVTTGLSSAPAKAGEYDTARTIAGIAALLMIGKALHDKNEDDTPRSGHTQVDHGHSGYHTHGHTTHEHPRGHGHGYGQGYGQGYGRPVKLDPKPLPPRVRYDARRSLPRACLATVKTRRDTLHFLQGRCLENNYRWTASLPRKCRVTLSSQHGKRFGYQAGCLKREGYRLDR